MSGWFDSKRPLALSIGMTGISVFCIAFPVIFALTLSSHHRLFKPLFAFLNEKYSAKGALLIFAGITFHSCIGGLFLKPFPKKVQRQSTISNAPNGNLYQERPPTCHQNISSSA